MTAVTHDQRFSGAGEDFGVRKGTVSVHLHTVENSDPHKTTIRDAQALMRWQDRDDVAGSYNRIMCTDGVLRCMEDHHTSGGINPQSSFFSPRSWLRDFLPAQAIADPNVWGPNLAAMGQREYFDREGWPVRIIDGFARSIIDYERMVEEDTGRRPNLVIDNHADYQPGNRTDAGPICLDLVMRRYRALTAGLPDTATPEEDTMNLVEPLGRLRTGTAVFYKPDTPYDWFLVGANPDPESFVRGSFRTPSDRGSNAPVDGPWKWTGYDAGWWRITAGPLAGRFLSRNGPQARIDLDPNEDVTQLQTALDSANKRTAVVKTTAAEFMRKAATATRDMASGMDAGAAAIEKL